MGPSEQPAAPELSVLPPPLTSIGGEQALLGLQSALVWLQQNQEKVNDLNVFPVPDGDTGSNMYLTLRSAFEEAQQVKETSSVAAVMAAVAHGSLMGARGNSGVILSQIFRGFSAGIAGKESLDAEGVSIALGEAAAIAYRAVMKPTEGIILTVAREASQAARSAARTSDDVRVVLERTVAAAHEAVERTIDQLPVLRQAGVVDAGGYGLAVILEGFSQAITDPQAHAVRALGEPPLPEAVAPSSQRTGAASVAVHEEGWGYCTEFLIHGPGLDVDMLRQRLGAEGDSALVVGDADLVRVHIHTQEPGDLITMAAQYGQLSKLKVEDMTAQHHDVLERADAAEKAAAPRQALAVVAVVPGEGFAGIFTGLGAAQVVEGGQTMNPSIENLVDAVRAANADSVILLPNNGNVILTAQQVDNIADDVHVVVVPTRNVPQGISALLALDPIASAADNAAGMATAVTGVTCVEITRAVRDSAIGGLDIKSGDVIAVVDEEIKFAGDSYDDVIHRVLAARPEAAELITVYYGAEVTQPHAEAMADSIRQRYPDVELELHAGGQDHYAYILSLE